MATDSFELLAPVWTHLTEIVPERAEGIYIYDSDGTRYTDFTSGIGVTNTGHCHPRVVEAVKRQAETMLHGQVNIVVPRSTLELAAALNDITPPSINRFFFSNSGAEAIEGAVKLAKHATGRQNVIVFQGSFHGRTAQTMAMTTAKTVYRVGYQPLPGGVVTAPFPYHYYMRMSEDEAVDYCLREFDTLLKSVTAPDETAAVVIEPVLGEGGYVPAPDRFIRELKARCEQHGILFIADEVQSGFGRTGKMFAYQHAGIVPDIIVMAKGLGSGLPISAIAASEVLMSKWRTGTHGGTYGGNGFAAAAAVATVQVMRDENLADNARVMGDRLLRGVRDIQQRCPVIGDVRGRGLMVATEFTSNGEPDADIAKATLSACIDRKLLLLTCGTFGNVIRWIPPLIVNEAQIDEALATFEDALSSVAH